jgi:uncharacterized protein YhbP (UPF0306 family)
MEGVITPHTVCRIMPDDIARRIAQFLDLHHVMSLATVGAEGPHAANVFYARDGLALFWVSEADSRHSRDIESNPRIAVTVAPDYTDFMQVRGVQMHGAARRAVEAGERARLLALLEARYPFLAKLAEAPPALREAYGRIRVYQFTPSDVVLIDNTQGFGHKETLVVDR